MSPQRVRITPNPDEPVEIEVLEKAIVDVSEGARKLLASRLTPRAIHLLIQDSISTRVPLTTIKTVLECAAELDKRYLKKA